MFAAMRRLLLGLALLLVLIPGCTVPRWPVDGRVTSPFGLRRQGLALDLHRGVDIAVPFGTPVRAMAPGLVAFAGTLRGYGKVVMIDHTGDTRTVYAHLSEIRVETGQRLEGRPVIALSGSTGRSSGPHLHFEVLRRRVAEDPVPLLGGPPRTGGP